MVGGTGKNFRTIAVELLTFIQPEKYNEVIQLVQKPASYAQVTEELLKHVAKYLYDRRMHIGGSNFTLDGYLKEKVDPVKFKHEIPFVSSDWMYFAKGEYAPHQKKFANDPHWFNLVNHKSVRTKPPDAPWRGDRRDRFGPVAWSDL